MTTIKTAVVNLAIAVIENEIHRGLGDVESKQKLVAEFKKLNKYRGGMLEFEAEAVLDYATRGMREVEVFESTQCPVTSENDGWVEYHSFVNQAAHGSTLWRLYKDIEQSDTDYFLDQERLWEASRADDSDKPF